MNQGTSVFSQIISFINYEDFRRCVHRYDGDRGVRRLSCWEQFLAMAFAQLTRRESLRDIEVSLAAHRQHLYHSGFRSAVKRSTLADANETRDWQIYSEFAQHLIQQARPLYKDVDLGLDLEGTLYALDSSIIDLSLTLFPWAPHERSRAAVKLNTLLDVQSAIPVLIDVTGAHSGDSQVLDRMSRDVLLSWIVAMWTLRVFIVCTKRWPTLCYERNTTLTFADANLIQLMAPPGSVVIKPSSSAVSSRRVNFRHCSAESAFMPPTSTSDSFSLPIIFRSRPPSSQRSIINAGRLNCFSNGSSSIYASSVSSEPRPMPSKLKSGPPWLPTP